MNKKSIAALAAAAAVIFAAGWPSYAWYTSTATSDNNKFKSGTLSVAKPNANNWIDAAGTDIDVSNMQPGDSKQLKITVNNNSSTLPLKYILALNRVDPGSDAADKRNLIDAVTFTYNGITYMSENNRSALENLNLGLAKEANNINNIIGAGSNKESSKTITVNLPENIDDTYQGAAGMFTVTVKATQTNFKASFK